jgi:hypothetical protein
MRDRRYLVFLLLAATLAVFPLILKGPSCGHDLEFHLLNWLEAGSQWKQGVLIPRWDFTAAWNSGEPRFVFYPPLSWTVGALLGLFLPWIAVPIVFIWLALVACGLAMHRLAREWADSGWALVAAAFYMVNPYMLFVFYERAACAELLAAAWIPLLMLAILRPRLSIPGIAVPICLLWLTNAPAAVMGCYAFAILGAARIVFTGRGAQGARAALREAAAIAAGAVLGIGLAAFYIVPATIEQRWVQIKMPTLRGVRYQDNFLFGFIGDATHDNILRTASHCGAILLVLAAIFLAAAHFSGSRQPGVSPAARGARQRVLLALAVLTCIVAFLLTSPSAILWRHVPELGNLQFPWRFCAILGAAAAALLALATPRTGKHSIAATALALVLPLALTLGGDRFYRPFCHPEAAVPSLVDSFYSGTRYDPTDEYTPVGADPQALEHANPAFWVADSPTAPAPQAASRDYSVALARRLHFTVATTAPRFVVLSLRDYPAWKVAINGVPIASRPHRPDGLIALPIASGVSKIDIAYAHTPDQIAGWIVSALSAGVLGSIWRRRRPRA